VVFVRPKPGPTDYGYECLGVRHFKVPSPELWQQNSAASHGGVTLDDEVVEDYDEVLWGLRALYGLKNFVGQRVVAMGGPAGKWDPTAPEVARQRYKFDLVEVSYDELAARRKAIAADAPRQAQLARIVHRYTEGKARVYAPAHRKDLFLAPYYGWLVESLLQNLIRLARARDHFLILEPKGYDPLKDVKRAAAERWCAAVNAHGGFGQWQYRVIKRPEEANLVLDALA
jgi:hypothetical protein